MQEEKITFIIEEDGVQKECEVICTFVGKENNKNYMIYTDNTFDEEKNKKVYAAIYDPEKDEQVMQPIQTDEEWEMVERILDGLMEAASESNEA